MKNLNVKPQNEEKVLEPYCDSVDGTKVFYVGAVARRAPYANVNVRSEA